MRGDSLEGLLWRYSFRVRRRHLVRYWLDLEKDIVLEEGTLVAHALSIH